MRSSISRFWIAAMGAGRTKGRIGMAPCPGWAAYGYTAASGLKDFEQDTSAIARWQPNLVLTLVDDNELWEYRIALLPQALAEKGIPWQHFPVPPNGVPDSAFEARWRDISPSLHDLLRDGGRLLMHCSDGTLRSGLLAGLLLVELGCRPEDAINRVQAARPGALTIPEQRDYVLRHEASARSAVQRLGNTLQSGVSTIGTPRPSIPAQLVSGLANLNRMDTGPAEHHDPNPPVQLAKYRQGR